MWNKSKYMVLIIILSIVTCLSIVIYNGRTIENENIVTIAIYPYSTSFTYYITIDENYIVTIFKGERKNDNIRDINFLKKYVEKCSYNIEIEEYNEIIEILESIDENDLKSQPALDAWIFSISYDGIIYNGIYDDSYLPFKSLANILKLNLQQLDK